MHTKSNHVGVPCSCSIYQIHSLIINLTMGLTWDWIDICFLRSTFAACRFNTWVVCYWYVRLWCFIDWRSTHNNHLDLFCRLDAVELKNMTQICNLSIIWCIIYKKSHITNYIVCNYAWNTFTWSIAGGQKYVLITASSWLLQLNILESSINIFNEMCQDLIWSSLDVSVSANRTSHIMLLLIQ